MNHAVILGKKGRGMITAEISDLICGVACWLFREKRDSTTVSGGDIAGSITYTGKDARIAAVGGKLFETTLSVSGEELTATFIVGHNVLETQDYDFPTEGYWFDEETGHVLERETAEGHGALH